MNVGDRVPRAGSLRQTAAGRTALGACMIALALLAGCSTPTRPAGPKPDHTRLYSHLVVLPAVQIGGHLIIEARVDRRTTARFLIDTGSSVTLLSPEFSARVGTGPGTYEGPQVRVRGANGEVSTLPSIYVRRLDVGEARFEDVQALVYDFAAISSHLGVKIDGILGFPLFRDTLLTLDYPGSRVILTPSGDPGLTPGSTFAFNANSRVPLIPVQIGDRTLLALIDSGSDGPFNLNPFGLELSFASTPRPGAVVTTLAGEQTLEVGRLADTLTIGNYSLPRPVVHLTDQLSSIGGDVLRHFAVTFDQARGRVTFYRDSTAPIISEPRRSTGLGFTKTNAYWRIDSVLPDSPAAAAGVQRGDLIVRIAGQPVSEWNLVRFNETMATSKEIAFTFLEGRTETTRVLPVYDLVP